MFVSSQPDSVGALDPKPVSTSPASIPFTAADSEAPSRVEDPGNCTFPLEYWSTVPQQWPEQISLGGMLYSRTDLQALMLDSSGDVSVEVIKGAFGAIMNIYSGVSPPWLEDMLREVDEWLALHPPGSEISEFNRRRGLAFAADFENFNQGLLFPEACPYQALAEVVPTVETETPEQDLPVSDVPLQMNLTGVQPHQSTSTPFPEILPPTLPADTPLPPPPPTETSSPPPPPPPTSTSPPPPSPTNPPQPPPPSPTDPPPPPSGSQPPPESPAPPPGDDKGKGNDNGKGKGDDDDKGKGKGDNDDKGKGKGDDDDKGKGDDDDKGKGKGKGDDDDKGKGKGDDDDEGKGKGKGKGGD